MQDRSKSFATDGMVRSVISNSGKDPLAAVLDSNNTLKKRRPQRFVAVVAWVTLGQQRLQHHATPSQPLRIDLSDNRVGSRTTCVECAVGLVLQGSCAIAQCQSKGPRGQGAGQVFESGP